jgi:phospholipid/cholesterol/gamma-HCH transport system substrate-binding protein
MKQSKNRQFKLGLLVSTGALLFILAVYYLGSKQNLFSSSITVKSYFYDVKGLTEGNKVRFGGINVGTVSEIKIVSDSAIQVQFTINEDVRQFIKKDSKVEIGQEGIMGNKIIQINSGSVNAESVAENDELQSRRAIDFEGILKEAHGIIKEGHLFATNLKEMSEKLNTGEGDLARLLNDSSIATGLNQAGEQLLAISKNVNAITRKVNEGQGDLGRLLNDTSITHGATNTLHNLDRISSRLDTFTNELLIFGREINNGDGLIQRLVYDSVMAANVDTGIILINQGVEGVTATALAVRKSWILNLFSGKKKQRENVQNK